MSLKHRNWARAKRQADEAAAGFAVHEPNGKAEAEPLTLGTLFSVKLGGGATSGLGLRDLGERFGATAQSEPKWGGAPPPEFRRPRP